MRATRLHFCRHGEVDPSWRDRVYGGLDIPLSAEGRARFERLALALADQPFDAVYSSDLERALVGARLLAAPRGLEVRADPRLREIDRGRWAGKSFDRIEEEWPGAWEAYRRDPDGYRGHGGESHRDLLDRVLPFLEEVLAEHEGGIVLLVCHGQVMRAVTARVLGIPGPRSLSLMHSYGGLTTIDVFEDGEWVVQALNAPVLRPEPWGGRTTKP